MIRAASFVITLTFLISGCVLKPPLQLNWSSDTSGAATLRCAPDFEIRALDGDRNRKLLMRGGVAFRPCNILLDAGSHSIELRYYQDPLLMEGIVVTFDAEPKHSYQLYHDIKFRKGSILYDHVFAVAEIDKDGKLIKR